MSVKAALKIKHNGQWVAVPMLPSGDFTAEEMFEQISEKKVSLPKAGDRVDHGTAGQFAVSDGKGGITWKTLVEAEAVMY